MGTSCELCRAEFSCARLYTALRLIEADGGASLSPEGYWAYRKIMDKLKAAGWSYPSGGSSCRLAGRAETVRKMVDELIGILRSDPGRSPGHARERNVSSRDR